jgi:phospholipid transport system substrate-binding protein
MNLRLLKILACNVLFFAVGFAAGTEPAAEVGGVLKGAVDEVLAIAYDGAGATTPLALRVRPVLEKYFNFETITRKAIGPGWSQFTPEQQASAVTLFTEVVIRNYADRFEAGERPGITYYPEVVLDPKRPTIRDLPTTIDYAGKKYSVVYRMEKSDASWRIVDVKIEGVSMIANWRAQLNPLFLHGGALEVIATLKQNLSHSAAK